MLLALPNKMIINVQGQEDEILTQSEKE